jgi:hypothetical protein
MHCLYNTPYTTCILTYIICILPIHCFVYYSKHFQIMPICCLYNNHIYYLDFAPYIIMNIIHILCIFYYVYCPHIIYKLSYLISIFHLMYYPYITMYNTILPIYAFIYYPYLTCILPIYYYILILSLY